MSLTAALNTARSSLHATSAQISISGKNISGAHDPNYSRKLAPTTTTADGGARIVSIARATDNTLYLTMLGATSRAAGQQALNAGLDRLAATLGDPEAGESPAARLSALQVALQQHADRPDDRVIAQSVVTKAGDLALALNQAAATVLDVRETADQDMASSVGRINDLLGKLETLNNVVVQGTFAGKDVTDLLDQRDAVLSGLSEEIGISITRRANNDVVVYADGGVTLFETRARSVTFEPSVALAPGSAGNAVFIDGVPVTGANATMPIHTGTLAGLANLRDVVAPTYERQLDEMARGLVEAFAESDQSGGGGADAAGLFTWSGGPAVPASGAAQAGIASTIRLNAAVDPTQGGQLALLRDGGINGAAYRYNPTAASAYPDRLEALADGLTAERAFDVAAGLGVSSGLAAFSTGSSGWLEGLRQSVGKEVAYQNTLVGHASDALSNATGVNLDDEYATQLQLEQSYAAASKLISVVNELFDMLMASIR